jgi:hypothetical protein
MFNPFRKKTSNATNKAEQPELISKPVDPYSETAAVISYALHLYQQEMHDYEQMILTIQKVVRPYSPWSSKIYGIRQIPRR